MPSDQPSRAPSPAPTLSSEPSPVPSAIPTSTPSFSSAPSANPVFVSSSGNLINFQKVGSEMDAQQVTIFEQKMLDFLATKVQAPPGTLGINFINVKNTRQKLFASRRLAGSDDLNKEFSLSLAFDVEAMVVLDETSINVFDFTMLLKMFWANNADLLLLRNTLEESGVLQSGPTLQIPVQSDGGKPIQNKNVADSSDAAGSIAGALAGIIFSIAGSAMLFIWIRNRKNTPSQQHTTLALEPASYSSKDIEDQYAYSQNYEGSYDEESDPPTPRVLIKQCTYDGTKQIQYPAIGTLYPVESIETSLMPGASAYYKPALIPMESNIEIPDTPGAGYEPSNYEPSNYESSTFSPKDIKFGEFDLDSPLPDVSKKREIFAGEQKMFSPQRTTNFFSPSIFGTKRMVKDNKKKNSFDQHSKNGSAHSPVRNDIRKHGISGVKENTPKNNMSSDQSRDISIGIMDEVKYLHSTSKKKKTRRHANNDEASPEEVPRFFSKPFDPFGDFD